jgi:hypothetical protein
MIDIADQEASEEVVSADQFAVVSTSCQFNLTAVSQKRRCVF